MARANESASLTLLRNKKHEERRIMQLMVKSLIQALKKKEVNLTYGAYLDSWANDYCIPNLKKTPVHD